MNSVLMHLTIFFNKSVTQKSKWTIIKNCENRLEIIGNVKACIEHKKFEKDFGCGVCKKYFSINLKQKSKCAIVTN